MCSARSQRPSTTPHFFSTSPLVPTTAIDALFPRPSREYAEAIHTLNVRGLRVAWSLDLGFAIVDPEVAAITRSAADVLIEAGQLEEVDVAVSFPESLDVYSKLEAVDDWIDLPDGLWPERADELDPQLIAGYEKGDWLTVRKFATTFTRRHAIEARLAALFDEIDVLITPTAAIPAFAAEGPMPREIAGQSVHPAMAVPFAMLGNMWGGPAISVPAGLTASGLPVGLHLIGDQHRDDTVLRLARVLRKPSRGRACRREPADDPRGSDPRRVRRDLRAVHVDLGRPPAHPS